MTSLLEPITLMIFLVIPTLPSFDIIRNSHDGITERNNVKLTLFIGSCSRLSTDLYPRVYLLSYLSLSLVVDFHSIVHLYKNTSFVQSAQASYLSDAWQMFVNEIMCRLSTGYTSDTRNM